MSKEQIEEFKKIVKEICDKYEIPTNIEEG